MSKKQNYEKKEVSKYKQRKYEKEIKACNKDIKLNPNNADIYYYKGNALSKLKNYEEAIEAYDMAIKLNPNDADGYFYK